MQAAGQTQTAEAQNLTQTAQALPFEARAAEVYATETRIALQAAQDAEHATGTAEAPRVAATQAWAEFEARQAKARRTQWVGDVAEVMLLVALIAVVALVIVVSARAAWKVLGRPQVIRRKPGEPAPLILPGGATPLTVHDPARQIAATASTDQTALPPGVPVHLQSQALAGAQAVEALYAMVQLALNQSAGAPGARPRPAKLPDMFDDLMDTMPALEAPMRVLVLPAFSRGAMVGELAAAPALVDTVDGEWSVLTEVNDDTGW
jgi:hypothetical protein